MLWIPVAKGALVNVIVDYGDLALAGAGREDLHWTRFNKLLREAVGLADDRFVEVDANEHCHDYSPAPLEAAMRSLTAEK